MSLSVLLLLVPLALTAQSCPDVCRCLRADYVVDCSNREITSVPSGIPNWVRKLVLSRNKLTQVDVIPFYPLRHLREIHLSDNQITRLPEGAFQLNTRLYALYLDRNNIQQLTSSQIRSLQNLRLLHLQSNNIQYTQPELLQRYLPRLVSLRLDANPIMCTCAVRNIQSMLARAEDEQYPAKCGSRTNLAGRLIRSLTPSDFTPLCPESNASPSMYSKPVIKTSPQSKELTPGTPVKLYCMASGKPRPSLAWYREDQLITGADGRSVPSLDGSMLHISELHRSDAGVYKCIAVNINGKAESRAVITVISTIAPIITQKPVDQMVKMGMDARFFCQATGRPKPKIQWIQKYILSRLLTSDNQNYIIDGGSLTVKNVNKSHEKYDFICTASSEYGYAKAHARISIKEMYKMSETQTTPRYIYGGLQSRQKKMADKKTTRRSRNRSEIYSKIIEKAKLEVSRAINATVRRLRNRNLRRTPVDIATLFRQPNEDAIRLSRAAVIYERAVEQIEVILRRNQINVTGEGGKDFATRLLSDDQLSVIARLSGCQRQSEENIDCGHRMCFHNRFRSIDGICNNLHKPRRGAALSPFYRLLPPQYENGVNEPIGWQLNKLYGGFPKPSARLVSLRLLSASGVSRSSDYSALVMQWGQFLDHDLDFTPVDASNRRFSDGVTCNETCVNESPCFPIIVPPEDKRIRRRPCIGFARSSATCGSGATSILLGKPVFREQINQITSYIDASNVYGSHALEAEELRELDYDEGKLREGMPTVNKTRLLPFNTRAPVDCQIDPNQLHVPCFLSGDHRANENLGLISMHTLWMREHNRIVTRLRSYNPHWSGNRLYYEGRKIVGAMMQHITYTSWLPKIIGSQGMIRLGRRYRGYDDTVDASISNVFATAAFRFGHTLINPILYRLNSSFGEIKAGHLPLHKAFFAPHRIVEEGGIDPVIRGLMAAGMKKVTPKQPMNTELTENLFKLAHEVSLDLGALNIQRGRDHGLPGYVHWRRVCNLSIPQTFDDLRWEISDPYIREKLRQIYGHPDNIDLFAGGVLEEPMKGAQVGPTFACVIIDQFKRLRSGDRFWYENTAHFSPSQLTQLRKVTLARVICDNSDSIQRVVKDAFQTPKYLEDYMDCMKIPSMDLGPWKECRYSDDYRNDNTLFGRPRSRRSLSRQRRSVDDLRSNRVIHSLHQRIRHLEKVMSVLASQVLEKTK